MASRFLRSYFVKSTAIIRVFFWFRLRSWAMLACKLNLKHCNVTHAYILCPSSLDSVRHAIQDGAAWWRCLLHRYWWNTRIFPFTKKSYLHRAQWRYYFYFSRARILMSPWLLTWWANYKRVSRSGTRPVLLKLRRNFISIYKINRTLHGRLGIRILSPRAESIS